MKDVELTSVVASRPVETVSTEITTAHDAYASSFSPPRDPENESTNGGLINHELAPIDGGLAAWRLLFAAFVFETLLWGDT